MKTKSILLLTLAMAVAFAARAYNHKWTGAASDAWSNGQNWTNNFPNPTENRAMRLFFPYGYSQLSTRQDIEDLFVDYMEIRDAYQFNGGPGARLGFRNTNADPQISTLVFYNPATFEDDLEIVLNDTVKVFAQVELPQAVVGTFKGRISGPGSFYQRGGGILEFSGTQANTYLGVTEIADGTLRLNKTGAVAIRGGLVIGRDVDPLQSPDKVEFLQANQFPNTMTVTIKRSGWLDLDNHSQTLAGLTMTGGRVTTGLGQLTLQGNVFVDSEDSQAVIDGRIALGYVPRTFDVQQKYSNECLLVSARISGDSAASLIKNGPGTLILSGTNSYNGATVINEGTLVARGPSPLGSAINGTVVNDGATLHIENADLGDEPLTLAGTGVDQFAALFVYGSSTGAGPVTLTAPARVTIFPYHTLTWYGVVSGPGDLELILNGRMVLNGDEPNTFTGTTYVGCDLELRKHITTLGGGIGLVAIPGPLHIETSYVRLFYDNQIADTSPVTLNHSLSRLELNGHRDVIGSLAGDKGEVALDDGELVVGGNPNSTATAALISGVGGRLRKIGPSTLTLLGTNTYTGVTAVDGGTLVINGIQPASPITVRSNATLAGSGTVGTIGAINGVVSPGAGVGRLNSKTVALDAASIFRVELNGPQSGVSHDQLNVTGTVSLGGSALQATLGYPGAIGTQFLILANDGVDPVVGTFAGKPQGATFALGGATFQISYQGGDGNDVVLTQLTESTQDFAPVLSILRQPAQSALLSWTTNAPGFQLLSSPALQPSAWTQVPQPVVVIGDQNTVTVPATNEHTMFRLFKP